MATLPTHLQLLLRDLRTALEALYGDRLSQLVLYGSQARGDTHPESDVDVLVVLEGPVQPGREIRRMSDIRTNLGLKYEIPLSLLPTDCSSYQESAASWIGHARREGIPA